VVNGARTHSQFTAYLHGPFKVPAHNVQRDPMPASPYYPASSDRRAQAFERVRRTFGWIVAGSVGAAAVIFGAISHELPGRSSTAQTTGASSSNTATAGNTGAGNSGNTGNTGNTGASAVNPPVSTQRAPAAVSGGTGW